MAAKKRSPVPKWKPAPEPWVKAFNAAVSGDGRVRQRKMFGYPAVFAGGNMAAGLHQNGLVLRLPDADREELLSVGGKPFEPMPGRIMSGFALAPESFVRRPKELRAWLDRSIEYASSLPAKKKR
jgi:TfoX/Sxy family transcriptional regulator of competence genes